MQSPDGEAKFWLDPVIALAQHTGLSRREISEAQRLVQEYEMTSATHGFATLAAEVTHISKHGFWILLGDEELFLPFDAFPWFRDAAVAKILNVEAPSDTHLYWPELDVDLAVESIRHPDRFPLISKVDTESRRKTTK